MSDPTAEHAVAFSRQAWADYQFWVESEPATARRVTRLIADCLRDPFTGIGKPEPLARNKCQSERSERRRLFHAGSEWPWAGGEAGAERTRGTGHGYGALKHELAGCWSRRITKEHRLVYKMDGRRCLIVQSRYHY